LGGEKPPRWVTAQAFVVSKAQQQQREREERGRPLWKHFLGGGGKTKEEKRGRRSGKKRNDQKKKKKNRPSVLGAREMQQEGKRGAIAERST